MHFCESNGIATRSKIIWNINDFNAIVKSIKYRIDQNPQETKFILASSKYVSLCNDSFCLQMVCRGISEEGEPKIGLYLFKAGNYPGFVQFTFELEIQG